MFESIPHSGPPETGCYLVDEKQAAFLACLCGEDRHDAAGRKLDPSAAVPWFETEPANAIEGNLVPSVTLRAAVLEIRALRTGSPIELDPFILGFGCCRAIGTEVGVSQSEKEGTTGQATRDLDSPFDGFAP